jgi:hypothetical protein
MEGISIGRNHSGPVVRHDGRVLSVLSNLDGSAGHGVLRLSSLTDFEEFFAPLFPLLADHSWLVQGAEFSLTESQISQFNADVLANAGDSRFFGRGFLQRWARQLVDDWCVLLGFRSPPADPHALASAAAGGLASADILAMTPLPDCAFINVDAVRWTFYAQDEALLALAREYIATRADLRVWRLRLGEDVV